MMKKRIYIECQTKVKDKYAFSYRSDQSGIECKYLFVNTYSSTGFAFRISCLINFLLSLSKINYSSSL